MNANPICTVVDRAGNRSKLARMLGVTPQAIRKWERAWDEGNHQSIPAHRAVQIENAVGMSRHELRPDLWPAPQEAA
jgi:DNA-binding transcriptional regulator YdaS (Cro superfamily)